MAYLAFGALVDPQGRLLGINTAIFSRSGGNQGIGFAIPANLARDVIQEVNKQPVKSAKDLVAISKRLKPNEKILIRVWSQGRSGFVALEPK